MSVRGSDVLRLEVSIVLNLLVLVEGKILKETCAYETV